MNNKGFTLAEAIASIVILSILLLIAVPSVNELNIKIRKKQMKEDGETFKNLVRNKINGDTTIDIGKREKGYFTLESVDSNKLTLSDYDPNSYVLVDQCDYKDEVYSCKRYRVYMKNTKYNLLNTDGTKIDTPTPTNDLTVQCESGKVWCKR